LEVRGLDWKKRPVLGQLPFMVKGEDIKVFCEKHLELQDIKSLKSFTGVELDVTQDLGSILYVGVEAFFAAHRVLFQKEYQPSLAVGLVRELRKEFEGYTKNTADAMEENVIYSLSKYDDWKGFTNPGLRILLNDTGDRYQEWDGALTSDEKNMVILVECKHVFTRVDVTELTLRVEKFKEWLRKPSTFTNRLNKNAWKEIVGDKKVGVLVAAEIYREDSYHELASKGCHLMIRGPTCWEIQTAF